MEDKDTIKIDPEAESAVAPPPDVVESSDTEEVSSQSGSSIQRDDGATGHHAPNDVSFRPSAVKFYRPPFQRQRWGDTQILPRVNWGDLFFDLFYVAAGYNVSNILVEDPSAKGLLYFLATFLPVMQIWQDKSTYDARFVVGDDLCHRAVEVAGYVALASAVVDIRPVSVMSDTRHNVEMFAFCVSILAAYSLSILRTIELYFMGVGEQPLLKTMSMQEARMKLLFFPFPLAAAIISGMDYFGSQGDGSGRLLAEVVSSAYDNTTAYDDGCNEHHRLLAEDPTYKNDTYADDHCGDGYISNYGEEDPYSNDTPEWLCAFIVPLFYIAFTIRIFFFFPKNGEHKKHVVPINVDFMIHRISEWIMLMLGESILSLLIVDVPQEDTNYFLTFYCSLATVILLQYLHFRSQPHHADGHALRRDKNAGILWSCFQFIYSGALIALGAAFTLFVLDFTKQDSRRLEAEIPEQDARFLAGGGESKYEPDELRQRAAHLFSASLSVIYFSLDMIGVLHVGIQSGKEKCVCKETHTKNYKGIFMLLFRACFLAFVATLSQWTDDPQELAGLGLASVVLEITSRFINERVFSRWDKHKLRKRLSRKGNQLDGRHDSEENKWPNTTQASADYNPAGGPPKPL